MDNAIVLAGGGGYLRRNGPDEEQRFGGRESRVDFEEGAPSRGWPWQQATL